MRQSRLQLRLVLATGLSILAFGCADPTERLPVRSAQEQAALATVRTLSYQRLTDALARLDSESYIESVNLNEFTATGDSLVVVGHSSYTKRIDPGSGTTIDSTTISVSSSASSVITTIDTPDLQVGKVAIPFDVPPAFVSEKQVHNYSYAKRDTTAFGRVLQRFIIRDRRESITNTTELLVEPSTAEVIQIHAVRRNKALLFHADNVIDISLEPVDDQWAPAEYRFDLRIKTPFRRARRFVVEKRFRGFGTPAAV